ncbi:peptide ABC transporter substrate-binding protein [Treponema phagedenis]|uniref:ABC transporter, substrate-binding protein, family 5 n=1 Tax=Treponema phagedenis TaxID=162 RepID=A0A0B7GVL9_TREPH|nr:peptide ABC transporter substrate-binding protein [Treponema phagedenis]NVP25038.1 peptide ABC transporter substrate-binding protein [Treponema phagedenis]QEJ94048.1 peptide ABC transporter substrate-binding protein [Treponema phagedenis]QEJ97153.1 peptide ABC transporter substrate-binding protein [Treponema phagedenis]QEK01942.1 peptide ABC transporter substrate-binding protein [Treponema phagedenis]QEK02658.1 peptide ABC transporter substrate-binding protein [Treponema phagedenis]
MYKKKFFFIFLLCIPILSLLAEKSSSKNRLLDKAAETFTVHISNGIPNLHPHTSYSADEAQILTALFEGLVVYDPYTLQPLPALAESWTVSSNGLTWIFHIRKHICFQNGDPITAETFKRSWLNLLSPEFNLPYASLLDIVAGAKDYRTGVVKDENTVGISVEGSDKKTLVVTLIQPAKHFINILCHHAFSAVHPTEFKKTEKFFKLKDIPSAKEALNPIASGPFQIEKFSDNLLTLRTNPYYWDRQRVSIKNLNIILENSPEKSSDGFNAGSIHWLGGTVPLKLIADTTTVRVTPMFATEYFYFKVNAAPTDAELLRKALLLAIPYKELRADYLLPAQTLIFPLAGYPSVKGIDEYNFRKAQDTLSALKPNIANMPPIKILIPENAYYKKLAAILKNAWTKLLLPVEIWSIPFASYYDALKTGDYNVGIISWIGDFADPLAFLEMFKAHSSLNDSGWNNQKFEKRIEEASDENDFQKRYRLLADAEQILLDNAVILPLSHSPAINVIDLRSIGGWYPNAINIHPFKFIKFIIPAPLPGVVSAKDIETNYLTSSK